MPASLANCAR
jgi:hypothetical protein